MIDALAALKAKKEGFLAKIQESHKILKLELKKITLQKTLSLSTLLIMCQKLT